MSAERILFTEAQLAQMMGHVLADRTEERCGLLAGEANRVRAVLPVPNVLRSAVAYQMDGREFIEAMVACNFEPLGIFHSHPTGPPVPSPTDIAQAMYPESVYIIIALNQSPPSVRAFRIVEGRVSEVMVVIE